MAYSSPIIIPQHHISKPGLTPACPTSRNGDRAVQAADHTGGALAGIRVVDLSRVLAGPLCTQMLADHGAAVIKIEPPAGDETRRLGPPFDEVGDAAYFNALNRGKRAISLDLSCAEGRAVLERLLQDADVLVENFLPGTMERWNIGYESVLASRYPRLIYCSVSGFGADGPLGGLPGYDAVLQAMSGLMSVNGSCESGPVRVGVPIIDQVTGYSAMTGILLALQARHRTDKGQRVEATLFDTALTLLFPQSANWFCSGQVPTLLGSAHPNIAPYDKFKAKDGNVFIGILNDGQFRRFCARIGRMDVLEDRRFQTNADRLVHRDALKAEVEQTLAGFQTKDLCDDLMRNGVPAGRVNTVPEAFAHPHVAHRKMMVNHGGYRGVGVPVKLSMTPGHPGARPPRFGEHANEILSEAGFAPDAIEALRAAGVLLRKPREG
jgi:crotonobetainyl-CoA:carnitine CoA-transferase CaiB-like acyl-CoA transferase